MQYTTVVTVSPSHVADIHLSNEGTIEHPGENGIVWRLRSQTGVVTVYRSGKVLIQGKDKSWTDKMSELLQKPGPESVDESFASHIGVDEAGKGDFFGPLVVGAVYVESAKQAQELRKAGVRDSKELSDSTVNEVACRIRSLCPYHTVIVLQPAEYNSRYKTLRNANKLLAQLHAQAIEEVFAKTPKGSCTSVVIDQFSKRESRVLDELLENGRKLDMTQMHKGERDVAVAAASILARDGFLSELAALSERYGIRFPKGASQVIPFGKDFVRQYGHSALDEVAKTSFRTALSITSTFDI